ncbi:MAG: hypothetical protein C4320_00940 [Armatimonadota bacterium]
MKKQLSILALIALGAGAHADLNLYLLGTVDVSAASADVTAPNYIGSNPSGVAWNGTDLYLGGLNSSGATNPAAVIRVADALTAPTFGNAFGALTYDNTRGISGLAINGSTLLVSSDSGTGSGDSLRAFNLDGTLRWNISATDTTRRATAGPAFDPGFNGAGPLTASVLAVGSGRRPRFDLTTGTAIDTFLNGPIVNFASVSTTWRDHTYDPATGDLYTRESNRVGKAVRTGSNSFSTQTVLVSNTLATPVVGQNIEFLTVGSNKTLIFNDRSSGSAGQLASSVIKASDTLGNPVAINLNGADLGTGNGFYDFSYDQASGTLAVMDFSNRTVSIFATTAPVPEPASFAILGLGAAALLRRRRR